MNSSSMEFQKHYQPDSFEKNIYDTWEQSGSFKPSKSKTGNTFLLPLPPPNVTGILHIGHALTVTVEDIMVRYHRMLGDETLWLPGTDHAGISTQAVVEKKLAKEGKNRVEMGREAFLDEVWKWKHSSRDTIVSQIRTMGSSCDWSKERFTLDEWFSKNVEAIFIDLYKKDLIYRSEYMVNYSPGIESVLSDEEVDYKEEKGELYYITYFVSGSDNELIVATTRPETLLADQAVAVNPRDKRYKKLIGKSVILPIVNKEIPIIADDMVDPAFGTGAVKITPAHDPADFMTAKRHNLRVDYRVIDKKGIMTKEAGIFAGQDTLTARGNIVELLKAKGNLQKIEPYTHQVGYCSRSGSKVETVVSTQWFVRSSEMIKKVNAGYKRKDFEFVPARFGKTYEQWAYNLRDWCISRQLWWGHQIPAYYHIETWELLGVTADPTKIYKKFGKENVRRDEDVLDTWFSSAIWPFATLDWTPENPGKMYEKFYPVNVLETGWDIIPFWVIRMLMLGYEYTKQTPFKTIYIHGLVRDEHGSKMSKSKGNGIDPIEIIKDYGTDTLRMSLSIGTTPGNDLNFNMKNVENNALVLNKFWNVIRFVHANIGTIDSTPELLTKKILKNKTALLPHEQWIMSRLDALIEQMTESIDAFQFGEAGQQFFSFLRDEFADFFVEEYKLTKDTSKNGRDVLAYATLTILRLAHPFVPFITEELWGRIQSDKGLLMNAAWPTELDVRDTKLEKDTAVLFELIRSLRSFRTEQGVKPGELIEAHIHTTKRSLPIIESNLDILKGLTKLSSVVFHKTKIQNSGYSYLVVRDIDVYIPRTEVDNKSEIERINKDIADKQAYLRIINAKLTNKNFVKNAPEQIIRVEQDKKSAAEEQLARLEEKLKSLS